MSAQVIELHNNDHLAQVEAAKQWLDQNMPGDVKAAREARNRMILALNSEGFTQRVIADAVECGNATVARVCSKAEQNGADVHKDPRGGARKPAEAKPRGKYADTPEVTREQLEATVAEYKAGLPPVVPWDMSGLYNPASDLEDIKNDLEALADSIDEKKPTGDDAANIRDSLDSLIHIMQTLKERLQ